MMRRAFTWVVIALTMAGCDELSPPSAALLEIAAVTSPVAVGASLSLDAVAYDGEGNEVPTPSISWSSDHPSIATVDANGLLTAHSIGSALIRARAGGLEATVPIAAVPARVVVSLRSGNPTLVPGERLELQATLFDARGQGIVQNTPIAWVSLNSGVAFATTGDAATADIAAVAPGLASIRATAAGVEGEYAVAVIPQRITTTGISVVQFDILESGPLGAPPLWFYAPEIQVVVSGATGIHLERFDLLVPGVTQPALRWLCTTTTFFTGTQGLIGRDHAGMTSFAVNSPFRLENGQAVATLTFTEDGVRKTIAFRSQPIMQPAGPRLSMGYFWEDCEP